MIEIDGGSVLIYYRDYSTPAENALKTACQYKHLFDEANTYYYQTRRYCRTCRRNWQRAYRIKTANPNVRVVGDDFIYGPAT